MNIRKQLAPIIVLTLVVVGLIFMINRGQKTSPSAEDSKGEVSLQATNDPQKLDKLDKIVIGVPNWPSGKAKSYIFKSIIEDNFGFEVELQNGSNAVIFEAMDKGTMHIHPETWSPNHDNLINKYEKARTVKGGNPKEKSFAEQNICVTEGTAQRTGIVKLLDLTDPEMAKKFDSNGDNKGEIWIGAAGWGSTPTEKIRAKSYGYDVTMDLKVMDEALAMAEVDAAVNKKQNIVFFCYAPHHIFILHKLVTLKEPPHDPSKWKVIQPTEDPQWLEKSYAAVAWKSATMGLHYSTRLEAAQPQVAKLFDRAYFKSKENSDMSYELAIKKTPPEVYARQWVSKNASRVNSWIR